VSLRKLILALILATSAACNQISSLPTDSAPPDAPTQNAGVPGTPSFLLDSSKYDSIENSDQDRYSCVGALVTARGDIIGSAVLIHPKAILTAQHCFTQEEIVPKYYITENGQVIEIEKVIKKPKYSETLLVNDICICILKEKCWDAPAELCQYPWQLFPQEELITAGWSLGYKKVSKTGIMRYYGSLVEDNGSILRMLALHGSVYYGDSGGAVFDERGRLAGIINFFRSTPEGLLDNGAARVDYHYRWIEEIMVCEVDDWPWYN
jgi:hypothetical protein